MDIDSRQCFVLQVFILIQQNFTSNKIYNQQIPMILFVFMKKFGINQ